MFDQPWRSLGFTLMEMLVVVAIIGILTVIAVPNYQQYVRKSHREDAQSALAQLRAQMERFYSLCYTYQGAAVGGEQNASCNVPEPAGVRGAPRIFSPRSPQDAEEGMQSYNLTIMASSDNDFWLKATPVGAQLADECGALYLHSSGIRASDNPNESNKCWQPAAGVDLPEG